ncbi:GDP-mannose 4,6-dehydratase [Neoconidiobolus thromboides FSU 785]|nr:GDP-mannose 4,6-dehydratase [Neoconidiobolus thromboides FSU 785]
MVGNIEELNNNQNGLLTITPIADVLANITPAQFHSRKVALITGITGQDGSYLAEYLLSLGYQVHGLIRRSASINTSRIHHLIDTSINVKPLIKLHYGDLSDGSSLLILLQNILPSEIYNLAAQSHVGLSFHTPEYTSSVDGLGTLKLLEAIRGAQLEKHTRFYQASTSEMFGLVQQTPQSESTPFYPRSPYGVAKLYAHWMVVNYREAYGLFGCSGILFNHESPRRGHQFVTRKITRGVAGIVKGKQQILKLGNLEAKRDWGHAKDYVIGMHAMLQNIEPKDYVLATGKSYSVKTFVELAFEMVGIHIVWEGKGINTVGRDNNSGKILVVVDPELYRPSEVDFLLGDATLAKKELNWSTKITLQELAKEMIEEDIKSVENGTDLLY